MNDKRRLHRNTGKNIQTALTHDIYNNPQLTWGRTDYIKGDITGNTWDTIQTQTKTNQLMMGIRKDHIRVRRQRQRKTKSDNNIYIYNLHILYLSSFRGNISNFSLVCFYCSRKSNF